MIGEFAWYGGGDIQADGRTVMPAQTWDEQVAWNQKLLQVSRGRVCGWLHWAFADTPTSRDLTRWSGLWTEDLQLKPWGQVYGQFAREATQRPEEPRAFPALPPGRRSHSPERLDQSQSETALRRREVSEGISTVVDHPIARTGSSPISSHNSKSTCATGS